MRSTTSVTVAVDASGRSRAVGLQCEVPQLVRVTDTYHGEGGALQLHLVGGAAGPLGGDQWNFHLDLACGAEVRLRSVAASLAQPDPRGQASTAHVTACLGEGANLDAWPEPLVSVKGSHHTLDVSVDLAHDATVRWVDEVVMGRHEEPSGTVVLRQRITSVGRVVAVSHLTLGEGAPQSFGANGPFRVAASAVGRCDRPSEVIVEDGVRAVRCQLGDGWSTWTAVASGHSRLRRGLASLGLER